MAGAFTQAFNLCRRLRYPDGWCISPCDDGGLKAIRRRDHHTLRISWKWLKDHGHDPITVRAEIVKRIHALGCDTCMNTGVITTEAHGTITCPDCEGTVKS
jgi:hypothetical protein